MTISVVVPVFHEEALINAAIRRLKALPCSEQIEIIVVDGDAEGGTLKALADRRVKGIVSGKGRGRQMNTGAAAASGDVILFLHLDTELPEDGFIRISRAMAEGRYTAGAFDLAIADRGPAFRIIERAASLRSRLTRAPYGDQAIFMRRDDFLAIDGYREWPIMEDVDLMRRVKRVGGKICFLDAKVWTSSRRWRKEGIIACTLRNWTIMLLYLAGVAPEKLAKWYK
jgi:rSAM/selenodomain-associated transferase 2